MYRIMEVGSIQRLQCIPFLHKQLLTRLLRALDVCLDRRCGVVARAVGMDRNRVERRAGKPIGLNGLIHPRLAAGDNEDLSGGFRSQGFV